MDRRQRRGRAGRLAVRDENADADHLAVGQAPGALHAGEMQKVNDALATAKTLVEELAAVGVVLDEHRPSGPYDFDETEEWHRRIMGEHMAAEPLFRAAALARATAAKEAMKAAEAAMVEAMSDAMEYSASYEEIGRAVGMSKQAAHSRVHKFLGEDSGYVVTAAEHVPVGAKISKRTGGNRRTFVADKRVGRANVTFYDAKDDAFLEVPIGTVVTYLPPVDAMPLGRA